ncbi:L,D-transpeptidase [Chitinophaga horti]|uniref:L,D-transpeptidase n=1 Tax=Chitinophaga horti TaxID=2920382 RepID=A0ABY6J2X6_9BACT|nr:L,D-transpeptidase [Chitinophaga horti]UYQ92992.1 L,D-transpeptidase [Chitinophaga horti]
MKKLIRYCLLVLLFPLCSFNNESDLYTVRLKPSLIDGSKVFLLVDKSEYRMYLYEDVTLLKIYKVVFGNKDQSDKQVQGDRRTPEGTFRILSKRMDNRWNRFMLLDYPNAESYQKSRSRGVSANTDLGGGIGIHGVESASGINDVYVERRVNWTLGCVSMKDSDVAELYNVVKVGTPVVIRR